MIFTMRLSSLKINYGMLKTFMDRGIASGEVAPMIVVTPDANFGTRRVSYFNDPDNNFNFENFFFKEFIPYIEKTYRCRTERGSRAVAGASMGGGAAFFYALHHPEMFSVSCPLSAAIRGYEKSYLTQRYPEMKEAELMEWYNNTTCMSFSDSCRRTRETPYPGISLAAMTMPCLSTMYSCTPI